jgi:CubicO group peptidase (beta-lactamase class C family)
MKAIYFICSILLCSIVDYGQPTDSVKLDIWSKIETILKENKIPALGLGIIRNNELCEVDVFGKLRKDGPTAPYNTIFDVASLTKPIVGMLTLKLVSMGKWDLDEPIDHYWVDPDIKDNPWHRKLTTRIILSHQTGFKNWRYMNPSGKLTIDFEPGTKFGYSGEGLEYLRQALVNKFKLPLDKLADSLIFKPLKMQDTRFVWDSLMNESRFADWHDKNGNNVYPTSHRKVANAADDLLTTVEDYGRVCSLVLKGFDLSPSIYLQMVTPQVKIADNDYFGLVWEIVKVPGRKDYALMHSGGDQGIRTLVALCPETGEGLIIFTNGDNGENIYPKLLTDFLSIGKDLIKFL